MQSDIAISVKNLTKVYHLYDKPVDRLKEALHPKRKSYHHDFYALSDVSFEIKKGETVGIIGRNGAGKSTLLKIITGVLTQTTGEVKVNGKIASLLELGAGFNPEMTGIENIYLNGTLMGFSKEEVDNKLDTILDFADIGEFVHQPVKMYSSGMFARLAFSIAINVEPDILIVDEALSVGDFAFQYKCFMRFKELKDKNVTILFVTHDMQQVIKSCSKAIFIHKGSIEMNSEEVEQVVFEFESKVRNADLKPSETKKEKVIEHRFGNHISKIEDIKFLQNNKTGLLYSGEKTTLSFKIVSKKLLNNPALGFSLRDKNGVSIWGDSTFTMLESLDVFEGENDYRIEFPLNLVSGEYFLYIGLSIFENNRKVDIDQRWRSKKIEIITKRNMSEGYVYAPCTLRKIL